jgi:AraC-like DNA-binding protein
MPLDIGIRGGCIALLALLALDALFQMRKLPAGPITFIFDLCGIAFLIETAPGLQESQALWLLPMRLASNMASAVFLLWSEALFGDIVRPAPLRWATVGIVGVIAAGAIASDNPWAWRTTHIAALALTVYCLCRVLLGRADDLVERRRLDRVVFAAGLGLAIVGCTAFGALDIPMTPAVSAVLGIALVAALMRLHRPAADLAVPPAPVAVPPPEPAAAAAPSAVVEDKLLQRLLQTMDRERAYRDDGLTIASLAKRLGTPEYRLREVIKQLGHGHFSQFINGYRLADARAALGDPSQAGVPILTIALDAGFGSIGPFNRTFKLQTGETPTEYRKRMLAGRL